MPPATFVGVSPVIASHGSTITLSTPSNVQARDTLLCFLWSGETNDSTLSTAALPNGWSLLSALTNLSGFRNAAWLLRREVTDAEPATHTFAETATGSGWPLVAVILAYRGLNNGAPLVGADGVSYIAAATTTLFVCPSQTLTTYSDLYLGFAGDHSTGTSMVPAQATKRVDAHATTEGQPHLVAFDLLPEATGATGTQTATLSASDFGAAVSYALAVLPVLPAPAITPDIPGAIGFVTVGV
jgi:hypothetical protein